MQEWLGSNAVAALHLQRTTDPRGRDQERGGARCRQVRPRRNRPAPEVISSDSLPLGLADECGDAAGRHRIARTRLMTALLRIGQVDRSVVSRPTSNSLGKLTLSGCWLRARHGSAASRSFFASSASSTLRRSKPEPEEAPMARRRTSRIHRAGQGPLKEEEVGPEWPRSRLPTSWATSTWSR